jgi:serine protease
MLNRYSIILGGLAVVALSGCSDSDSAASSNGPDIGGTIAIESRTRIDRDTADDVFAGTAVSGEVVSLPDGAVAAGYLSQSRGFYSTDAPDDFEYYRDAQDEYAAVLSPGDRVVIQLFGAPDDFLSGVSPPGLRVELEAGGQTEQRSITGFTSVSLDAIDTGDELASHSIRLVAEAGAPFRYVITLVSDGRLTAGNFRYSEPAFRPGEAVVVMDESQAVRASAASVFPAGVAARSLGKGVWHLRQPSLPAGVTTASSGSGGGGDTLAWVRQLQARPGVLHADPNYLYFTQQTTPNPQLGEDLFNQQWNLPLIQLPLGWQLAPGLGNDVGVAVMDTGLFTSTPGTASNWHSDLDANVKLVSGQTMDFVSSDLDLDFEFGDRIGRDTNPADPGDGTPRSSNFHGTHVAGIISATDNDDGIIGVAPFVDLYPIRVLGRNGEGSLADLIVALNWAAGRPEIDVINLSLGGLGDSASLKDAVDGVRAANKLVVAAAGNQGTSEPTYPAAYSNVVGVGAVDRSGRRASYSNVGASVDLVAPGGDYSAAGGGSDLVISTWGLDDGDDFREAWAGLQGTSMAAPHVSALYALMKSGADEANRDFGPDRFFTYLVAGDLTAPPPNRSEYGYGLIDAVKAVSAAREGNVPGVILAAQPTVLQFTRALTQQSVELVAYPANASVSLDQSDITTPATEGWLQAELGSDGRSVDVMADASDLADSETRRAEVTVTYDDDGTQRTLTIPVTQQTGDSLNDRNAGRHYVLLVSTGDDQETVQQQVVEADSGQYRFAFNDVPRGEYFLVAGTDTDNNGLICESGEACAEYPVNGLPEPLVFNGESLPQLSLSTSFRRPTISALGEPRYGFRGYRIKPANDSDRTKRVRTSD